MADTRPRNNKTTDILQAAAEGKYGVVACIAYNVEHIIGFVRAAEIQESPLIIQLFPWAITYSNGLLVHAVAIAARQATVPVAVHLDHCQDEALVRQACELPFDSIMVDMSHHAKDVNLAKTRELIAYVHSKGKSAEAEPGRIEGGEDGLADTADLTGLMTTNDEVQQFLDAGVDTLAPAFGNVHGNYGPRGIVLEWDRLRQIQQAVSAAGVFIALHGVNQFPVSLTRDLISAGVTKINLNRDILEPYYNHVEKRINKVPFTQVMEEATQVVCDSMAEYMDWVQSTGKAST
ncbi:unnamed protein product [Clonostachys rosea]|uniref:Fructose-bisphosphate aldolase n=1 Tax=Bionectria ochroleuca TaxID=29856 RepID=A0ABY6U6N7_BIOOC|nr:unnamed protein product [Clonostachys rosea]